ncbi:hypothetical protein PUNSTDRAFT_132368 [Punctularia strigosozonata HHB-11173 SS5]|uniref:uncharacterized protein n=1 Tax=Punctularia strigosozonata (strain HHB-11173) TaxID=741275 RepID=UPI0004416832|nr:uncharacterized protein PUNSTDRAFT_132368 [Punctularia strigosozonata HHB-11173 SS5]EIN10274.1 hypothetical protein PUNSTDRAFT_132368 [Punctularia strigosozonata HHB-11173 SS5]
MAQVPNELVQQILRYVNGPSDLANVVRVCRNFNALALPYLYENVVWTDPRQVARNLPFWVEHAELRSVVSSLTFSISYIETGLIMRHPGLDLGWNALVVRWYADEELYNIVVSSLASFSGLRQLRMTHSRLPDEIFAIIHDLPSLRELHVVGCVIPLSALSDSIPDYASLQITDLTLWGVYDTGPVLHPPPHPRSAPLHRFYSLMSCPTLRRLHLLIQRDSDLIEVLSVSARSRIASIRQLLPRISAGLEELTYAWQDSTMKQVTQTPALSLLQYLLQSCSRISKLTCLDGDPVWMPKEALPRLRTYRGPAAKGLARKLGNSPIVHLSIEYGLLREMESKDVSILPVVEELHAVQLPLRELSMSSLFWDDDLLYAVFQLFPGLYSLELRYTSGCPSEVRSS